MVCRAQSLCYRRLDGLSVRIAALLEEKGEWAIPVFGCSPMRINERGEVAGYLNHIRMGELAGIGAIDPNEKRIKVMRCLNYTSRTAMSKTKFAALRAIRPQSAARLMNLTSLDEHTLHVCSKCVALCPYGD
jgi:hypothetical protein